MKCSARVAVVCPAVSTVESLFAQPMRIMGVVNATPDSFSDGGRYRNTEKAIDRALAMASEGADVLDIGGESTRPGAAPVALEEELDRVIPVIRGIAERSPTPISVDTTKPEVARRAIAAGACIVNDVGLQRRDPAMAAVAAEGGAGYVVMHSRGTPRTMRAAADYTDPIGEVCEELQRGIESICEAGIPKNRVMADIGLGFAKDSETSILLLANLRSMVDRLGVPVLVGASRKSFLSAMIDSPTHTTEAHERDPATIATTVWSFSQGASMVRVHDVTGAVAARQVMEASA